MSTLKNDVSQYHGSTRLFSSKWDLKLENYVITYYWEEKNPDQKPDATIKLSQIS